MNRRREVYTLKDEIQEDINLGCDVLENHEKSVSLIKELKQIDFNSIYFVGCRFGEFIVNTKKAFPEAKVGGCEVSELYLSFGKNTFGVEFDVMEPPYRDIPEADIIVCDDYTKSCPDLMGLLKMMFEKANKYVILFYDYKELVKQLGDYENVDNNMQLDIFDTRVAEPEPELEVEEEEEDDE